MIVYESVFLRLEFFKDDSLIEVTWLPATENITDEEYKEELLNYLNFALELKPKRAIMNSQSLLFTASPTIQEWTDQTIITPSTEVGLTKVAVVMSKEFIASLAIEQLMEDTSSNQIVTIMSFKDKEEAREWVLSISSNAEKTSNLDDMENK
ncbi:hypothetical protein ACE193_22980 [Bernardetia sp. OM2101]|uniref:hypothetical protein n=1 Tax=Bernardetia sp. OM2101 TaxID=3344876 RepID=UPI0035D0DAA7